MGALGLKDQKTEKAQDGVVSCVAGGYVGKWGKSLDKAWASLPIEVSGNRRVHSRLTGLVDVGGEEVLTALTAISPGFLEMFALTEGGKNLFLWQPNIFPSQAESSRGNNLSNTKEFIQI